ncbi:glycosyltransferase family 4 protein [Anaerobaca lacustris]|uniref:Glycosyltransferase family 4 protein n=1 Tax=Anaerobaca lacustris TaxID=3044600 RepID=A0AAW6TQA0_9BACT|nr:glycosyltransferase family 4 protein [Sedimentisphaerales bacterium M17dextr]
MRLAFVTSFPDDPAAPAGGVEAVSVNLVEALAGAGDLDIDVVTTHRRHRCARVEQWNGVRVHRLPWAGGSMLRNAVGPGRRQMQSYLRDLKPDVIHAHDTYGLMVQGMSIPRVFTIHGFIHGDTLVSGERLTRLRSWIWQRVETAGWADQPHIISISPYVRERLRGIATGVIHDVDNPIAERFFNVCRAERQLTIFSAALVAPRKNTLALVDAVAKLTAGGIDCELRLAGSLGDETYVRQVRQRIQQGGLEPRVSLLGKIGTEQVLRELATASVFALVSLEENSPMGIEEAMAAGVPVVTSNRCGMPYMVRDGESGFLVDPHDPHDIARRLRQLLGDDALRHAMGAKGREIALDRFHPARVAARTRHVYEQALTALH